MTERFGADAIRRENVFSRARLSSRRTATRGAGARGCARERRMGSGCHDGVGRERKRELSFETLLSSVRRVRPVCAYTVWPAYAAYERKSIINETHVPRPAHVRPFLPLSHAYETRVFFPLTLFLSPAHSRGNTDVTTATINYRRRLALD